MFKKNGDKKKLEAKHTGVIAELRKAHDAIERQSTVLAGLEAEYEKAQEGLAEAIASGNEKGDDGRAAKLQGDVETHRRVVKKLKLRMCAAAANEEEAREEVYAQDRAEKKAALEKLDGEVQAIERELAAKNEAREKARAALAEVDATLATLKELRSRNLRHIPNPRNATSYTGVTLEDIEAALGDPTCSIDRDEIGKYLREWKAGIPTPITGPNAQQIFVKAHPTDIVVYYWQDTGALAAKPLIFAGENDKGHPMEIPGNYQRALFHFPMYEDALIAGRAQRDAADAAQRS